MKMNGLNEGTLHSPGSRDRRLGLHQDLLDMERGAFAL
jgi:hypothetical protein